MHTMCSRTAAYLENPRHTWWVKQGFPVCLCEAERCQCTVQVTNANKRGRSFLEWWKLSFLFLFQGSLLCFKQTVFGAKNKTHNFPSLSLTWDIFCGTYQRHDRAGLEAFCKGRRTKHKKIKWTLPMLFWKTPTPSKIFCAALHPLGILRACLAVKTLGMKKHLVCTQEWPGNYRAL